jgi:hypothetical protein
MTGWFNSNLSQKLTAFLIVGVFVVVMFACFTTATDHGYGLGVGAACETVMNLVDNAVAQTGLVLLLIVAAACLCFRSFNIFSLSDTLKRLQFSHSPPPDYLVSPQEYSYLQKLFSSGLIHAKLHSVV